MEVRIYSLILLTAAATGLHLQDGAHRAQAGPGANPATAAFTTTTLALF
jgi:hypothetical protein